MADQRLVILDHDGGHDDLVALCLLLAHPTQVRVIGSVVTDADCFVEHGFSITGKLMTLMHAEEGLPLFPIGKSSLGGVNPFPSDWRWSAKNMEDLPCVNMPKHSALWESLYEANNRLRGEELLADLVLKSDRKVTICVTGPLSNVAWCVEKYGESFTTKVEECIIMGGAVSVGGNVFIDGRTDGTAEWNIFWDPPAAKTVFDCTSLKKVMFTLDSTNHVPVTSSVVRQFGAQNEFLLSQFVGSAWASCTHHELMRPGDGYFAWDVLTAAYAVERSIADFYQEALDVVTEGDSEGRTVALHDEGRTDSVIAKNVDAGRFYSLVLDSMKRCKM